MSKPSIAKTDDARPPTKSVLEAPLVGDEKILWSSRPGAGAYALPHIHSAVMGLTYFILAVLWNGTVVKSVNLEYASAITWLFVLLGSVYAGVPVAACVRSKIYVFYALTTKRLLIVSLFPSHVVQSFPIESVHRVVVKDVM